MTLRFVYLVALSVIVEYRGVRTFIDGKPPLQVAIRE